MCVTVWVLRYKNKKNGDRGTIVFTATLSNASAICDECGLATVLRITADHVVLNVLVNDLTSLLVKRDSSDFRASREEKQNNICDGNVVFPSLL